MTWCAWPHGEQPRSTKGYVKKPDLGRGPEALAIIAPPASQAGSSDGSWVKAGHESSPGSHKAKAEVITIDAGDVGRLSREGSGPWKRR